MLTRFDRTTIKRISMEIDEALAPIAERYGIDIRSGGGEYVETNATLSFKLSVRDETGTIVTRERSEFERYAVIYGLTASDFGREFVFNGHRWTVAGLNSGRTKYPILATKHCDGKMYKLSADVVKLAIDREGSKSGLGLNEDYSNEYFSSLRLCEAPGEDA